nr:hypothetical protein [uncultured Schaedlerella sp.]
MIVTAVFIFPKIWLPAGKTNSDTHIICLFLCAQDAASENHTVHAAYPAGAATHRRNFVTNRTLAGRGLQLRFT